MILFSLFFFQIKFQTSLPSFFLHSNNQWEGLLLFNFYNNFGTTFVSFFFFTLMLQVSSKCIHAKKIKIEVDI